MKITHIIRYAFLGLLLAIPAHAEESAVYLRGLDIVTKSGTTHFTVEPIHTPNVNVLMDRKQLWGGSGMLFLFNRPQQIEMSLADTMSSMDVIFVNSDGNIIHIEEDTMPMSKALISSGNPVIWVLEVKGGTARRIGIQVGDHVVYPTD